MILWGPLKSEAEGASHEWLPSSSLPSHGIFFSSLCTLSEIISFFLVYLQSLPPGCRGHRRAGTWSALLALFPASAAQSVRGEWLEAQPKQEGTWPTGGRPSQQAHSRVASPRILIWIPKSSPTSAFGLLLYHWPLCSQAHLPDGCELLKVGACLICLPLRARQGLSQSGRSVHVVVWTSERVGRALTCS